MASGHVNRANRPNTWLHRPSLRREVFPCQLGAVHTWHDSSVANGGKADEMCSGRVLLSLTPKRTLVRIVGTPRISKGGVSACKAKARPAVVGF
jgi:hypothetical protein